MAPLHLQSWIRSPPLAPVCTVTQRTEDGKTEIHLSKMEIFSDNLTFLAAQAISLCKVGKAEPGFQFDSILCLVFLISIKFCYSSVASLECMSE